jgi:RNA polymerase sigma-70 factor (ECF subfamily)
VNEIQEEQQAAVPVRARPEARREALWPEYIARIARGDEQALATLYDESSALLHSLALRMLRNTADAEEIVVDIFSQVWRSASSWDQGRGSVTAWLLALCRNRCIDRIRTMSRHARFEIPAPDYHAGAAVLHDNAVAAEISYERDIVLRALQKLNEEERELIEMAFFSGLTHTELSARLQLPLGTVKSRIRGAMRRIRHLLKGFTT